MSDVKGNIRREGEKCKQIGEINVRQVREMSDTKEIE